MIGFCFGYVCSVLVVWFIYVGLVVKMCDGNLCEGSEGKFVFYVGSFCGLYVGDCIFDYYVL